MNIAVALKAEAVRTQRAAHHQFAGDRDACAARKALDIGRRVSARKEDIKGVNWQTVRAPENETLDNHKKRIDAFAPVCEFDLGEGGHWKQVVVGTRQLRRRHESAAAYFAIGGQLAVL